MAKHRLDGVPPSEELLARAAARIVREWSGGGALGDWTGNGVTIEAARAAVERNFARQQRLGPELAAAQVWIDEPAVVDLTDPGLEWAVYLDHGELVLGRVE